MVGVRWRYMIGCGHPERAELKRTLSKILNHKWGCYAKYYDILLFVHDTAQNLNFILIKKKSRLGLHSNTEIPKMK